MAGEAAGSGLRFFLDCGLGAFVVPGALRAAGWTLETMDERYGADQSQRVQDTQWIEEATLAGDVLLCKDLAIAQNPLEAQAVYMTSARAFALSNAAIAGPVMAQWYLDNESKIVRAALRAKGPCLRRARLAYPPDLPRPAGATVVRAGGSCRTMPPVHLPGGGVVMPLAWVP